MTTLSDIRTLVRRDLKDEDSNDYRWTDNEIDRAIERALYELSFAIPYEQRSTVATENGSYEIDISQVEGIENLISVDRVEFPIDEMPREYRRFKLDETRQIITLIDGYKGDGNNCYIYWSSLHSLDDTNCSLFPRYHALLALGASGYAAISQSQYHSDRANIGGDDVDRDYTCWARDRLKEFRDNLRLYGRRGKLGSYRLYPETDHEGSDYE